VVVGMIGVILYHNICIFRFSIDVHFDVIVISADRQVKLLQCVVYFFRYF
jgi:hypothetical protein